ncbi:Zinc finger N-recognin protein [Macrophomina phaseolina MS6]|uniref:E3 ubiquitin-protein ligase n=1 Tax=Macrophomina phaseolina (strain MS6) TaxID=1126212 RepID=K2RSY3_MACPH|nr:Zinc finger N-recognin protein [Macrophomina phaseolina MS6]
MLVSTLEEQLCKTLRDLPKSFRNRYTDAARRAVLETLFRSLAANRDDYLRLFFPQGPPSPNSAWSLRDAQGAVEGAEYTEAARGHPCGHIFKSGEATYRCKTCTVDDTCVLCAKCFDASDHEGHLVYVSISPGNSGCCDCGDPEAWVRPVHCNIHTSLPGNESKAAGKAKEPPSLPEDLVDGMRTTIARALDYLCDVFSCSPEQLRLPKTEESIREDERLSRLTSKWYGGLESSEEDQEFALVLWNDEKHTVMDVENQLARACKQTQRFGRDKAYEVDDIGRSVIIYSDDVKDLLRMAKIIEEIKLTVTIRSARDTFREQMCETIVEWISDISGCSVGPDQRILRNVICEEMLKPWRMGSEAHHAKIGRDGIDDHEAEDAEDELRMIYGRILPRGRRAVPRDPLSDEEDENWEDDDDGMDDDDAEMEIDQILGDEGDGDVEMDGSDGLDSLEASEATFAGYPPPPPPPPVPRRRDQVHTPADSDGESLAFDQMFSEEPTMEVPKTPKIKARTLRPPRPAKYWQEKPEGYHMRNNLPVHEDLWQRVRLDFMILYDLRMWKKVRIDIRDVFISTVVTIPYFKRILGLRFAALYTTLAQLYLIADREPDHSIINLSLQMLTTPSITAEVVERGNFLTNLMAILYTFLTTRQVGYPSDVNPMATLAFEAGAVTNRRMYHFFLDMKYLLGSEHVQEKICQENRYLLQFLDLVKLHQGICPNVRAVGEHIEYETDAWISASLITREINKLCRQFSESFMSERDPDLSNVCRAIRTTAKVVIIHSMGAERKRFSQAELKRETTFKILEPFEADSVGPVYNWPKHKVVDFVVEKEPMSFHHALHYTLSWLIDRGKAMPREQLLGLLLFSLQELRDYPCPPRTQIPDCQPDEYLLALFDFPLRVCAWLAQMRAGMWVRNGITLRHQMTTYRGVTQRDNSHQRDIFLLQVGLVICPSPQFFAQMIDRFGMTNWVKGDYAVRPGYEDLQTIDVAEDFVHLLIILLSDRSSLLPPDDSTSAFLAAARRDIAHTLCFKPMAYSDLTQRFSERLQDYDKFGDILKEMTIFRAPEGLSDSGTFTLKEQYIEEIDPYIAHYNRNSREEAENIYKNHMAKKTGKDPSTIVFEPKLPRIKSGIFKDLAQFTKLPLFAQFVYYFLGYALASPTATPNVPNTRLEAFVQFVLQLIIVVVNEELNEYSASGGEEDTSDSFTFFALSKHFSRSPEAKKPATIVSMLRALSEKDEFKACEPKIRLILSRIQQRQPVGFETALPVDRMDTASPAAAAAQDKELKKKQALERQARVMAQFKEQQSNFMANQAIDWGDDLSDEEDFDTPAAQEDKTWKYPSGTCILCQEETDDQRLYGTFAFISESGILRQTDVQDQDWLSEAATTPVDLDRSAEHVRPFGVSGKNRKLVQKTTFEGKTVMTERQDLSKGFPYSHIKRGPVSTGCGHIMHYSCFEVYNTATHRRHVNQIARQHPERPEYKEFMCPLCKALGNAFLPIIWEGKTITYPGVLEPEIPFDTWLDSHVSVQISKLDKGPERGGGEIPQAYTRQHNMFYDYGAENMIAPLSSRLSDLSRPGPLTVSAPATQSSAPRTAFPMPNFLVRAEEEAREPFTVTTPEPNAPSLQATPPLELFSIYKRLRDTMRANMLQTRYSHAHNAHPLSEDLTYTDTLAKSLGFSIAATEIAQRGIESDVGCTLLDKISEHSLTHLRVLSETVTSYLAVGGIHHQGKNRTNTEFLESQNRQLHQLMFGHPLIEETAPGTKSAPPLFLQDPFIFLAECSVCLVPALHLDIHHVMRLCYLAEIVKAVSVFVLANPEVLAKAPVGDDNIYRDHAGNLGQEQMEVFSAFVKRIVVDNEEAVTSDSAGQGAQRVMSLFDPENINFLRYLRVLISTYALPFVRKAVILMHVRYGIEFPDAGYDSAKEPELQRLSKALRLPSLHEIFSSFLADGPTSLILRSTASGWIKHWVMYRESKRAGPPARPLTLSHPAIFELVGLPKNYDTLTDEAIKRKCPTVPHKELTDPCVCLFCGEIFCSQAVCCMKPGGKGGCMQHQAKCGGNIGMFINIRKCMLLYTHHQSGSWFPAPYLDKHGETDMSLRRQHQLYLHQKRYDALVRSVWLHHQVPSTIARKLEGDINNGGWETM